jgi:hypothetical protein
MKLLFCSYLFAKPSLSDKNRGIILYKLRAYLKPALSAMVLAALEQASTGVDVLKACLKACWNYGVF